MCVRAYMCLFALDVFDTSRYIIYTCSKTACHYKARTHTVLPCCPIHVNCVRRCMRMVCNTLCVQVYEDGVQYIVCAGV